MHERDLWRLGQISDEQLVTGLRELLKVEGRNEARVIAHLAELEERRIALKQAQSLFEYCQTRLGFSDNQAYYRIAAARAARRFPVILELLERREIHLVNIAPLSKHLTEENHRELLGRAGKLSKRAFLKYLASCYPRPDVASQVRRLIPQPGAASAGPTGSLEPLSAATYRLQLNTSDTLKEKLELARDLMSHANPSGDLAVVVERALDVLITKLKARRFGETQRPRRAIRQDSAGPVRVANVESQPTVHSGQPAAPCAATDPEPSFDRSKRARPHIPNEVRHEVTARDGIRCCFVSDDGRRCTGRALLELDHEKAWGTGGLHASGNLRWLCRAHNQLAAEITYGREFMRDAIAARKAG